MITAYEFSAAVAVTYKPGATIPELITAMETCAKYHEEQRLKPVAPRDPYPPQNERIAEDLDRQRRPHLYTPTYTDHRQEIFGADAC